ncbi:MAG TPA: hypothetical protein DDW65_21540 [Firmicutes bacterium]|jgi:hypothetical protein|nr:hypothetical protein [Bacillota bacterium]
MPKTKTIQATGPDGRPVEIELIKNPKKKKEHKPKESSITANILEYLNSLPGVKAKKRHQSAYQRNEPDIDACTMVYISVYTTKANKVMKDQKDATMIPIAIAYKFEVKKPGEESTPAQKTTQEIWKSFGVRVHVVFSKEDVRKIMIMDGFDTK